MGRKEPCPSTKSQSKVDLVKTFDSHTDVTSDLWSLCAETALSWHPQSNSSRTQARSGLP